MTGADRQPAVAGGIGGGVGTGVAVAAERLFAISIPIGMVIAVACGVVVSLGLLVVIRN